MQISSVVSLAIGASNENILTGTIFEILPGDGVLQFGFTSDAAPATSNDILLDVYCGLEVIAVSMSPSTAAVPPIFPDHFTLNCPAMAGDRIIVKARNGGAGARKLWYSVVLDLA